MPTLHETLLAPDVQPQVVDDCQALVDHEVAEMSGVTGTAVRLAYKTVRTFDAGHIRVMIESLLPDVTVALQPYWDAFTARPPADAGDFGGYLASREEAVAEALLAITDERRRASGAGHHRQGLQHRPRQRDQAREGGPARPRRPGPEVRGWV